MLTLLLVAMGGPAQADDDREHDHDRARAAVESGQVLPLRQVLERIEREHPPGTPPPQVLEVELEQSHGRWIYEVKLLLPGGRLVKRKLDARTGAWLDRRGRAP